MKGYLFAFMLGCLVLALYSLAYIAYCKGLGDVVNVPLDMQVDWGMWTVYMVGTYISMVSISCLGFLVVCKVEPWHKRPLDKKVLAWLGSIVMLFLIAHTVFLGIVYLYFNI